MVLEYERIVLHISVGCEIFRVFGYFVIFLVKNIVEISYRRSKYCERRASCHRS